MIGDALTVIDFPRCLPQQAETQEMATSRITLIAALLIQVALVVAKKKPNIVFVLTDDQDQLLGSMSPDGWAPAALPRRP